MGRPSGGPSLCKTNYALKFAAPGPLRLRRVAPSVCCGARGRLGPRQTRRQAIAVAINAAQHARHTVRGLEDAQPQ